MTPLISFLQGVSASPIFVRYIERLRDYHVASQDFTEAGLTLKVRSSLEKQNAVLILGTASRGPLLLGYFGISRSNSRIRPPAAIRILPEGGPVSPDPRSLEQGQSLGECYRTLQRITGAIRTTYILLQAPIGTVGSSGYPV